MKSQQQSSITQHLFQIKFSRRNKRENELPINKQTIVNEDEKWGLKC